MPELPEVETIVRQLRPDAAGKKISGAVVKGRSLILPSAEKFERMIGGLKILSVTRQGKFIVFNLSKKMKLVIHLRMTGRLMWKKQKGREKYIVLTLIFTDGTCLHFSDVRKFGRVWLYPEQYYKKATGICRLGADPLGKSFSFEDFRRLFSGRNGSLKAALLRQDLIAGVGNIYADEICFNAGLSPARKLANLTGKDFKSLYKAVRFCLNEGIKHCGVSVSDFVGISGRKGLHQNYLQVYGRHGEKCRRCAGFIHKTRLAGRGTYYCPSCQR